MNREVEWVDYYRDIRNEQQEGVIQRIDLWVSEQRPVILSPGEYLDVKKRELSIEELNILNDRLDYWPIRIAKGVSREQSERFRIFIPRGTPENKERFFRYMFLQSTWAKVGNELFFQKSGRLPERLEKIEIVDGFADEFRVYYALREIALEKPINYDWAEKSKK